MRRFLLAVLALAGLTAAVSQAAPRDDLKGEVKIDGSSTVYLITEAMATEFKKANAGVNITVGLSGTGGGFKKFSAGETDINDASRAIKPAEIEACQKHNIRYTDFQVAWDGITVVVNPQNTWARKLTVEQLKKIWHPEKDGFVNAKKWSDVDPSWPKEEIKLFGPGTDSGTFDFFTEAINGHEKLIRTDYNASATPNTLVSGIAGNKYALGYFGLAYFEENKDKLAEVAIAAKEGGEYVLPSRETVLKGTYKPLARPLFVYVRNDSLKRPEVQAFLDFYLRRADLVDKTGYIKMTTRQQDQQQQKLAGALGK
jgi:phosphate transport system substrate-binding protein